MLGQDMVLHGFSPPRHSTWGAQDSLAQGNSLDTCDLFDQVQYLGCTGLNRPHIAQSPTWLRLVVRESYMVLHVF